MLDAEMLSAPISDLAVGLDLGGRFCWMLVGWGIIFRFYGGISRAITNQEFGAYLAIMLVAGLHLGVCF